MTIFKVKIGNIFEQLLKEMGDCEFTANNFSKQNPPGPAGEDGRVDIRIRERY